MNYKFIITYYSGITQRIEEYTVSQVAVDRFLELLDDGQYKDVTMTVDK